MTPRSRQSITLGIMLALTALAFSHRFIQDDAYISFVYARNFIEGHGLVFNIGERVEGFTNPLWTFLIALGMLAGFEPAAFAMVLGLLFFSLSLLTLERIVAAMGARPLACWAAMIVAGTNYTFSAYATGGLETSLVSALVLLALFHTQRIAASATPELLQLLAFSLYSGLALLTRLDTAVFLTPMMARVGWSIITQPDPALRLRAAAAAYGISAALLGGWMAWKTGYYGELLPNTWYAKRGAELGSTLTQGATYLYTFAHSYLLIALFVPLARGREILQDRHARWLLLIITLWLAYVVYVGGGFMEFRFLVPVIPLGAALLCWVLFECIDVRWVQGLVVISLIAGSIHHRESFEFEAGIESVAALEQHVHPAAQDWIGVGQVLGDLTAGAAQPPLIAVTAAGAIPYFSRLPAIDMLGLNDAFIARHGLRYHTQPGHERLAPYRYLDERGVNLIIAHPLVVSQDLQFDPRTSIGLRQFRIADADPSMLPPDSALLEIPMPGRRLLYALYLHRHPAIDRAIVRDKLRTWPAQGGAPSAR